LGEIDPSRGRLRQEALRGMAHHVS
jgi:hypothetical protein